MGKIRRRCKCGCENITNLGRKYINGHNSIVKNPNLKHGLRSHKLYKVWADMKYRCSNPKNEYYYQRGIKVCIRWRKSFKSFYIWAMSNGYKEGLEIDRIDNNGNYTPDNCRILTHSQNMLNKGIYKNNTSGHKGISFCKDRNKYRAYTNNHCIGYFYTIKHAIKARNKYINGDN